MVVWSDDNGNGADFFVSPDPRTWERTESGLLADEAATSYEVETTFDLTDVPTGSFTFRLRTGSDGASARDVIYDIGSAQLDGVPLAPADDGALTIRLLVDRGQLAVFAADGAYYACYNVDFDTVSTGDSVQLTTTTPLHLQSLTLHQLSSIWPGSL